ncbi:ABC-F family ATP-binding cassette domain-containing protein [Brevundimonas sp.]|jgi:ATPase subunit of ABC transporter with duplicated ATPase domains|uniref:ABC-F family ATP-binding cassette domain-containing protein n=1 Tax=Brevundimonas sp. TaxID=1871086 RepID=UPI002E1426A5|nr:ABC-F family ATP-binding cassette domain-containing protein [Brevundimonas sp.]
MPSSSVPPRPAFVVTLSGLGVRTPDGRTLFSDLTLAFGRETTGVVGRNGCGKSTLLRLMAGVATPFEGTITRAGSVAWLEQEPASPPAQTVAAALGVEAELARIARITAGAGDADDLDRADWTLEARLDEALAAVGLAGLDPARPTASLSGGERTRLELARLELADPDLLLLDEPTNHLDAEARDLVRDLIARRGGGTVVISHDRSLLRHVDRIIELSELGAAVHGGGWDMYVARREAERAAAARALGDAERVAAQRAREAQREREKKARRDAAGKREGRAGGLPRILAGMRADQAQDSAGRGRVLAARRQEAADAALAEARARVERVRALDVPMPPTGLPEGRLVLRLAGAGWATPENRRILVPVDLTMTGPERIAIAGPNGAGKTTLLRLIHGDLAPTSGTVERPVPAALLDQKAAALLPGETLVEAWLRLNPGGTPNDAQAALARFLFRNAAARKRVAELSGGERLRAALACVMTGTRPPQLLVLDEPTNHLDLDAVEAVEAALAAYDGALIVVSHDREFLDAVGIDREIALRQCG